MKYNWCGIFNLALYGFVAFINFESACIIFPLHDTSGFRSTALYNFGNCYGENCPGHKIFTASNHPILEDYLCKQQELLFIEATLALIPVTA